MHKTLLHFSYAFLIRNQDSFSKVVNIIWHGRRMQRRPPPNTCFLPQNFFPSHPDIHDSTPTRPRTTPRITHYEFATMSRAIPIAVRDFNIFLCERNIKQIHWIHMVVKQLSLVSRFRFALRRCEIIWIQIVFLECFMHISLWLNRIGQLDAFKN